MKKKIAREYFLFLVGLGVTGLSFLSLVLWTKYYENLSREQHSSFYEVEEEHENFNKIYEMMSYCYHDIETKEKLALEFLKVQFVENLFKVLNQGYANGTLSNCEIELRDFLLELYKTPRDMHLAFSYENRNILDHFKIESEKLNLIKDKIIPYNAETFRYTLDYRIFRVDKNIESLSSNERSYVESYLWDFKRHNNEYDLFEVPLEKVDEFIAEVPIVEEVEVKIPFGKTILSKTVIVAGIYFIVFFVLRYFYYTIVWSIRTMRSQ